MKKPLLLLFLLLSAPTWACDLCGCANGGAYFGLMPQVGRPFVGLRYRYASYDSHLNSTLLRTKETFMSTEIWGRFYPINRVQVLVFVPYFFNQQEETASKIKRNLRGLGDATVLTNYSVFNTFWDSTLHHVNHSLLIGVGVKVPTGRFKYDQTEMLEVNNPNFQLGTGSVDFMLNGLYSMRVGNWGWNTDVTYKINTENSQNYQFGNRLTANSLVFYAHELPKLTLMPNTGIYSEIAALDKRDGFSNSQTGGWVTMANMGMEVYLKRLSLGATAQVPVAQNLADHQIRTHTRATVHITVML